MISILFNWIAFCCFEFPVRLLRRSPLWVLWFIVIVGTTIYWIYSAGYKPNSFAPLTKYFCGVQVITMLLMVFEFLSKLTENN